MKQTGLPSARIGAIFGHSVRSKAAQGHKRPASYEIVGPPSDVLCSPTNMEGGTNAN